MPASGIVLGPYTVIVTSVKGMSLPLVFMASLAIIDRPPQQGTSICTTVMLLMSERLSISVNLSW